MRRLSRGAFPSRMIIMPKMMTNRWRKRIDAIRINGNVLGEDMLIEVCIYYNAVPSSASECEGEASITRSILLENSIKGSSLKMAGRIVASIAFNYVMICSCLIDQLNK